MIQPGNTMFAVTLQTSARKSDVVGYFANEDVAQHVAGKQQGFDSGEGPVCGVVTTVDIDMSTSVAEYEASLEEAAELEERKAWADFYEDLTDHQKALMQKFAPASLTQGA